MQRIANSITSTTTTTTMNDVYTLENRNFVVPEYVSARLVDAQRSVSAAEGQLAAPKRHEAKRSVEGGNLGGARRLVVRTKAVVDGIWDARQAVAPAHHLLLPASASRKHSYNQVYESLSQSQRMAKHIYEESARALKALLKEDEETMEKQQAQQQRAQAFCDSSSSSSSSSDSESDSESDSGLVNRRRARCENGESDEDCEERDDSDDSDVVELARKRLRRS